MYYYFMHTAYLLHTINVKFLLSSIRWYIFEGQTKAYKCISLNKKQANQSKQ